MAENNLPVGKRLTIRECGYDEYWLQDHIVRDPSCLTLGELEVVGRERLQPRSGRLDILLKDPEDDSMFEVEVMLGETDESHIIRTIEYWDNEKRRWPQRQHSAVLVAESITRRFFNVIQLLSHAIPIIAVQVNVIEAGGIRLLNFTKVLDTYEEPEDEPLNPVGPTTRETWQRVAPWVVEAADAAKESVASALPTGALNYKAQYIGLEVGGNNYLLLFKRSGGKSRLSFWLNEANLPKAMGLLDECGLAYTKRNQSLRVPIDKEMVMAHRKTFAEIASLVRSSWEE